jgi:4-hydroxybenzoate polyprenyltransferase
LKNIGKAFFYSNIYLGITAVLLCVESNLLLGLSLNYWPFYVVIFLATIMYYTMIYVRSITESNSTERTSWYKENLALVLNALKGAIILIAAFILFIIFRNRSTLFIFSPLQWLLIFVFPLLAAWYTFSPSFFGLRKIRQIGLLKPFVVGLTWVGWVTFYPVLIWQVQKGQPAHEPLFPPFFLWFQNFLLFSINAIIFDIKDLRTDIHFRLKTFPVIFGVRNTWRFVVYPLFVLNIAAFVAFQVQQQFSFFQTILQSVGYLILLGIIITHRKQKPLLYYLAAVDGLLLVKAVCGITSVLILKK